MRDSHSTLPARFSARTPRDETLFRHALLGETPFRVVGDRRARPELEEDQSRVPAATVDPQLAHPQTPPPCETEFRSTVRDETEFRHEERVSRCAALARVFVFV